MMDDKPAYRLFNSTGTPVPYGTLLDAAGGSDIVLFGELHDIPICHWLELELARDLYARKGGALVLGGEMFESDTSTIIQEYLADQISESYFESQCRLWPNYGTDYKPLVEFARENKLPFIATNIPRRYASIVLDKGFEGLVELSDRAKEFFPPLPIRYDPQLPFYRRITDLFDESGEHPVRDFLPRAQAVKDATMAHFILRNWSDNKIFLHYHGTFHADNFEGIAWYLRQENPRLKILLISSVLAGDPDIFEDASRGLADYILCIPERMTRTY